MTAPVDPINTAASANGVSKKNKKKSPSAAAPSADVDAPSSSKRVVRPDRQAFNNQIDEITREIDSVKANLDKVRESLNNFGSNDKNSVEKKQLEEQIQALQSELATYDEEKSALQDQLKAAQDAIKRRIDEVKSTKDKMTFRSTVEIDRKLAEIDALVSTGTLKLTEEKRLLTEATNLRKHRNTIDSLAPQETAIEMDKKRTDDLRRELDKNDPKIKQIKKQLRELYDQKKTLQAASSESSKNFNALKKQREELSAKMNELLGSRREMHATFKKQRDEWDAFMKEEKARKDALYKARREEYAKQKKLENAKRALEEAEIPAFEAEIKMCSALASLLAGYTAQKGGEPASAEPAAASPAAKSARPVHEGALPKGVAGTVMLKKKSDRQEDDFYVGKQKKKEEKHQPKEVKDLKLDLAVIDQFLKLSVTVPSKPADIPKTLEALAEKKKYFEENQARVTKENIEKAKALEQKLLKELEDEKAQEAAAATAAVGEEAAEGEEK